MGRGRLDLFRARRGGKITGPNLAQPVDLPGTDFRIRADGSAIEPVTGGTGTFGFALTEAGDRLTHKIAQRPPSADMSALDVKSLAREVAGPLFWRRQTAQRLLVEKGDKSAAPTLRETLAAPSAASATIITALHTLDGLGALTPRELQPFISHADVAVRVHALQLADRWFAKDEGRALLEATLMAAPIEQSPRVQIQIALSLGESRDPRVFTTLARYALLHLSVRWMDTAILSSLHGQGVEMLATLIGNPRDAAPFLAPLAQSIAARRDEAGLARALALVTSAKPETQAAVLGGLAKGRKNAPRKPLGDKAARVALATLSASPSAEVRKEARAFEDTFVGTVTDDEVVLPAGQLPPVETISDGTFRKFVAALARPRDVKRGHELFVQACATCHRISKEGHDVGPDLLGQIGLGDEALLKDILMPNERMRPGYETTLVQMVDGTGVTGILKDDGATSLTLALPNGVDQALLRKDVAGVRRLATSLMPSFEEGLAPADVANLLAWLRSQIAAFLATAADQGKARAVVE